MLDKRDLRILQILEFEGRANCSTIAKKIQISKQAVEYRIKKLMQKQIISGYFVVINIAELGYTGFRIALKLHNVSAEQEKEILNQLRKQQSLGWLFSLGGTWDIALTLYAKDVIAFEQESKRLMYQLNPYISKKNISVITTIHIFPNKFLFPSKDIRKMIVGGSLQNKDIDAIDYSILQELTQNARISALKISEKINQHVKTVSYRIKKLEKEGIIIGYRTNINTNILGYEHYKIFLFLTKMNEKTERKLVTTLTMHSQVVYLTTAIGIADLEFEIKVKNVEEMYKFMELLREEFKENISDYDTLLVRKEELINFLPHMK
jgi:Lrp/AsnC family transcriptional regulator for asnA, asnC and gidA